MKYLFLIIRHIFPRRRWKTIESYGTYVKDNEGGGRRQIGTIYVMRDQFGNLKTYKSGIFF